MSIRLVDAVMKRGPAKRHQRMMLAAIANHADNDGYAFPGQLMLGSETCVQWRTVNRTVAQLEADGWVAVTRRSGVRNEYRINVGRLLPPSTTPDAHVRGQLRIPLTRTTGVSPTANTPTPDVGVRTTPDVGDRGPLTWASPEPSITVSGTTSARARATRSTRGRTASTANPAHPHEPNVIAALTKPDGPLRPLVQQHAGVDDLVALAYQAGRGDPWTGYLAIRSQYDTGLGDVRDPIAVLRHRLGLNGTRRKTSA